MATGDKQRESATHGDKLRADEVNRVKGPAVNEVEHDEEAHAPDVHRVGRPGQLHRRLEALVGLTLSVVAQ